MFYPPKIPLRNNLYKLPKDWLEKISDQRVTLCSAVLAHCIRQNKIGSRALRIYILGKSIQRFFEFNRWNFPPYLPLKWVKKVLRRHFPRKFKEAWNTAIEWGLLNVWPESNACQFPSPKSTWENGFRLLKIKPADTYERGSVADIIYTTHVLITARIDTLYKRGWTEAEERQHRGIIFIQGLNDNGYIFSLTTFGRLLNVCDRTLMRWSQITGEYSQRRCITVVGSPKVPEWDKKKQPQELQYINKPIPDARSPGFKILRDMLDKSRNFGDNGHRTLYFVYHHKQKKFFTLARRIPNVHKFYRQRYRVKTHPMSESLYWVKGRNRLSIEQMRKEPDGLERCWYSPSKREEFRKHINEERKKRDQKIREERSISKFKTLHTIDRWLNYKMSAEEERKEEERRKRREEAQKNLYGEVDHESPKCGNEPSRKLMAIRHFWKQPSLNGLDGKAKPGVNMFNAPIYPVKDRIKEEWRYIMPDRKSQVNWSRIYSLGQKKIKPKKSIWCNNCHQRVSHLPHPAYHTHCPNCNHRFVAIPGFAA